MSRDFRTENSKGNAVSAFTLLELVIVIAALGPFFQLSAFHHLPCCTTPRGSTYQPSGCDAPHPEGVSINIDTGLTLSNLSNSLPPNPLRVRLLTHFDTLSVYRGSLCEQVGRASTPRSANQQRLSQHETSNNKQSRNSTLALSKNIAISVPFRSN